MELAFSSQTTARLAGITSGQLTHWGLTDIAIPSIDRGRKQGRPKKWSFSDVVGLRVIRELLAEGLSLRLVRRILPELRAFTGASNNLQALAESRLVVLANAEVAVVADTQTLVSLFPHRGQTIITSIFIELRPAVEDIQRAMLSPELQSEVRQLKEASAWLINAA